LAEKIAWLFAPHIADALTLGSILFFETLVLTLCGVRYFSVVCISKRSKAIMARAHTILVENVLHGWTAHDNSFFA
jgi:hypothetical protein